MKEFLIVKTLVVFFFTWRVSLFIVSLVATLVIVKFGARFPYYNEILVSTGLPSWIWGFGNFDGVHYLNIAKSGYSAQFTQVFFPLFPMLINFFNFFQNYFLTGLLIANLFFLLSIISLYKLFRLDFDKDISLKAVILLLTFPTAFYFGAIYSESLFLLLSVLAFYLLRKKEFFLSGVFIALATATRIFGILLVIAYIIEFYYAVKERQIKFITLQAVKPLLGLLISPLGLITYMAYLKINFNDPLYFLNAQPIFGAERTNLPFVLLPQVIFRYIKILLSINVLSLPFLNALLELIFTLIPLFSLIFIFKKIRFSYWVFSFSCLILPTLTGTLSSMPRYSLMMFLSLPLIAILVKRNIWILYLTFTLIQAVLLTLFIRGYWVA